MLKVITAAFAALSLAACATTDGPPRPYMAKGQIDAKYQAEGPWPVAHAISEEACDRENHLCDIWYPADLGANPLTGARAGFRHPVISWANGSGQKPSVYIDYLRHLASWGFVVVAARDDSTRDGATTVDAANYILREGERPSSPFYRKLDRSNLGAAGHSQGGASVTSLHARGNPLFKTYVGFHSAPWFFSKFCCAVTPDTYRGTSVTASIFQWSSVPDSGQPDWYDAVPDTAEKVYARLTFARHADIGGSPGCYEQGCSRTMGPYLGYSTAWLMWRLQGAAEAGQAFRPNGEFFRTDPAWSLTLSNIR